MPRLLFEFGPFRLDLERRLLEREQEEVHLPPKQFELLVVFVTSEGLVVTPPEIRQRVWPWVRGTANPKVSFDRKHRATQQLVCDLRKVLGSAAIVTVKQKGYRFNLPVVGRPAGNVASRSATAASSRHHQTMDCQCCRVISLFAGMLAQQQELLESAQLAARAPDLST